MDKINILLVDDDALLRQGLRSMLEKETFVNTIYEAESEHSFFSVLGTQKIDLILLDVRLRGTSGVELMKKLKTSERESKVIAVTGLDGTEVIINLLKVGVNGIVYKLDGYSEIVKSIAGVMDSDTYFPEHILRIIQSNVQRWDQIPTVTLSVQEKDLLKAIAGGDPTKQIASLLKMPPATVETYRSRLMKKLSVPNTAALLAYAFRNGLL
jgi:two-component system response regulator NreC